MRLYVLVLDVNREWRGFHERDTEELKALFDQLVKDAIGYRGKIIGSELVEEPDATKQGTEVERARASLRDRVGRS